MQSSVRARARWLAALAALILAIAVPSVCAASVTTVAGGLVGDGANPQDAALAFPGEIVFDAAGNLYIADQFHHRVRKVTPAGAVSTFAGTGASGFAGDGGQASQAKLNGPWGLAFDTAGNLYISEKRGHRIRKVTPAGTISTVAGDGTTAVLNAPGHIAVGPDDVIYVSETNSHRVRKIVGGVVSTFAGVGTSGSTGDAGPAISAKLYFPYDLLVESDGSVLIADSQNSKIRRVDAAGTITTYRSIGFPYTLGRDGNGVLHVAGDYGVFMDNGAGGFNLLVGELEDMWGYGGDGGPATQAKVDIPMGIGFSGGNLYFSDYYNGRVRVISGATINTFVGPGAAGDGGQAVGARLMQPAGAAYDAAGNLYVTERYQNRVRKISPAGLVTTVAGSGISGTSDGGGNPLAAEFDRLGGIAVLQNGDLLVADWGNNAIRRIATNGTVSTFAAGTPSLQLINQLAVDPAGNVFASYRYGVAKIASGSSQVTAFAGPVGGTSSPYQDGVQAATARTGSAGQIGFDAAGNVYFTDPGFQTVRRVAPNGVITTVAGTAGVVGSTGDGGPATAATLTRPRALYVEPNGDFVVGEENGRLRRVVGGVIQTIAGTGEPGFNGDGAELSTHFDLPYVMTRNGGGSLIVADHYNNRLRSLPFEGVPILPTLSVGDASVSEGNAGTKSLSFTISLSEPVAGDVTFDVATSNGTATAGSDYVALSAVGQVIPAGQTSTTVGVTINGDAVVEADETFSLTASNVVGAPAYDSTGVGTIGNDDVPPSLSIADVSIVEGDSGTKNMTFTVQLSSVATSPVQYTIRTEHDSTTQNDASEGSDYVGQQLEETIAAGQSSKTFTVVVNGDTEFEADELFNVRAYGVSGATIADGVASGTITNDDVQGPLTISIADGMSSEGDSGTGSMSFQLSLSRPAETTVNFSFRTQDGSAVAGSDYTARDLDWSIPAGDQFLTISVPILGDTLVEPDEVFNVVLQNVTGAVVADGQAIGWIDDNDVPRGDAPTMILEDAYISEGQAGTKNVAVTVRLSHVPTSQVWFVYSLVNDTAASGSDYQPPVSQEVFIAPGANPPTLLIPIVGDSNVEGNETFRIQVGSRMGVYVEDGEAVVTIVDDESGAPDPMLSIADAFIVNEGNAGTRTMTFHATLSAASTSAVSFNIATQDLEAAAGSDYVANSVTGLSIPAGSRSASFSVTINGDTTAEPHEAFLVNLSGAQGATIIDAQGIGMIANDDNLSGSPVLRIDRVTISEGNSGTKLMNFALGLSVPAAGAVTFDVATSDGSAQAGSDYVARTVVGQTIPAGSTSANFSVTINGDTGVETDEFLRATLSNVTGASLGVNEAEGMILDDDNGPAGPTLSIADVSVAEGNAGGKVATFTVQLSEATDQYVVFEITTLDGTATAGVDYAAVAQHGYIGAGQTSTTISVTLHGDTDIESNETFAVNLSSVFGALVVDGSAVGTITNDDSPGPTLSIGDLSIAEGNSGTKVATFTVNLSQAQSGPVFFDIATADATATAGSDYVAKALVGQRIAAGMTSKPFTVTINGDTAVEADETFVVNLSNPVNVAIADGQAIGTISNDDAAGLPTLSIGDVSIVEGNAGSSFAAFTVTMSAPSSGTVTFNAATSSGTATAGSDYVEQNWGLNFQPGQTELGLQVPITGDTTVEADETFSLNLSNVVGASLADGSATGTIVNDDVSSQPSLSIGDVSISEGNSGTKTANFVVNLSAPAQANVFFDVATADGTASGNVDYMASFPSGVSIPAGQSSVNVPITINGDTTVEPNETFTVTVSNVSNAIVGDGVATGTITNDDSAGGPTLSVGDVSIAEGNSGTKVASFTVTLSAAQSGAVFFDIGTADQTAVAGSDYIAKALTGQRIAAGATSKAFTVTINGDTAQEADETFVVNLSNPVGATLADGQATGTISNDDAAGTPTLSIADASVSEGNSGTKTLTFTVSLSPAAPGTVTYDIATSNGTATAGSDYVASSLTGQTITAGQTSKTFVVTLNGDTTNEADETFTVTLSNVSGATLGDGSAVGTISNDDGSSGAISLSIGDVSITEGNSLSKQATFTVTLSAPATTKVTYNIATANGTAVAGTDYTAKSLTGQAILAGASAKTFTVAIKGDTAAEPNETFVVNVTSVVGATVADGQATGTITNDDGAAISVARLDAQGLVDDLDDGNGEVVLSPTEYATLLHATASQVCERTHAATIVGVDNVEGKNVLADLADAANGLCTTRPRYTAVMGEGSGFLVEATSETHTRGATVIGKPETSAQATKLQVQGHGHAGPISVMLPRPLSVTPTERNAQLRSLGQQVQAELKANERVLLIGNVTVPGLTDLTARSLPATSKLPAERILVSPALLEEFGKATVAFPAVKAAEAPAQVLQLQR